MHRFVARFAPLLALIAALVPGTVHAQGAKVYAADSLRAALTEASGAFSAYRAGAVTFEFGPSGVLKDRLARGERADVFASDNMEHPRALQKAGKSDPVQVFARKSTESRAAGGAEYGLVTLRGASPTGYAFVNFLLGPEGQRILAAHGFSAP